MKEENREFVESFNPEALVMDGYDDCIEGVIERFGSPFYVVYNYDKVIGRLVSSGMTLEEAQEWYSYNMVGAYVGEATPCFIHKP